MPIPPPQSPADESRPADAAPAPRKRLSRRASLIGTVIALLVAAGLAWLAWDLTRPATMASAGRAGGAGGRGGAGGPGGPGGGRGATTVGVAVAQAMDIPVNLDALGTVTPQATVRVRPQVSGVLTQVLFKEGQSVKAGQLLATIDPRPFENALQQATGQRMKDEAQLAAARVTLARYETLLKQDSIARQDVDTQAATVHQLEATIVSDKAAEGTARLNLSWTRITSPIDGRVGLRTVDLGNQVSTSDANGIAVITKMTPIDVQFAIPQDNAAWLQHNGGGFMEVRAYDRTKTTLLDSGVFASLDNQIDTTTGTVRAKARFNNARLQLFPSQFVNVQLQVRTIQNAVVVPVAAVRQSGSGEFVFVLQQDHTVKQRPVVRGQQVDDRVQIVSGLQVGERVITEGADRLRDGARVTLPGESPQGGGPGGNGGRRRNAGGADGAAPGVQPAASAPFTGASAAQRGPATSPFAGTPAVPPQPEGSRTWARGEPTQPVSPAQAAASSAMGAPAASGDAGPGAHLSPEERAQRRAEFSKLSPEERAKRREEYQKRRAAAGDGSANPQQ
ncbi:efflux RND transporter periplasmic adaptor subunit [Ramlibacter ginsenosidimutans]|uniref:Efflux RND transporter periplasmic adaptor subunit n=2 Tax=Ramlibacter ginsenosidimutans TaxID=502333 RepID=A0A934WMP5_9BURK|nr:efflux RND transporter periplasmic adaptor subunit [Ramlibacter ginsenosidimutans]MBK6006377.1 efflux RND transporter periplasmic adaptor subunit [Ramlibacter ginsenosidimutans]